MKKILVFILILTFISIPEQGRAMECLDLSMNLRQGAKDSGQNKHVYALQSFLKEKGYLYVNPTGYFGTQTVRAVKALQKANAVSQVGTVGPLTRALIKQMTCVSAMPTPETPATNTENPSTNPTTDNSTQNPSTPVVIVDPAPTEVVDVILTAPNNSSLKVRTEGVGGVARDSVVVKGVIISGARSGTMRWFELTKNPDIYKMSETLISTKVIQRTNDRSFQEAFNNLTPNTNYYFRVCAGNDGLGQRSCGSTVPVKTLE